MSEHMDEIRIVKKIDAVDPVMIAGWPGMGSVALGVVDYLRRKLAAQRFADIALDPSNSVDSVVVEEGIAKAAQPPKNVFYYVRKPEMVICEGEAQLSGRNGVSLLNKVLTFAKELHIKAVYSGAAFPVPISYKDEPEVYCAVNGKAMLPSIVRFGAKPMEGGHISGLNGLILALARDMGVDAACLLATMPQYAISLPNPRASRAIIEALQKMLDFKINMAEMDEYVKDMDEKMALIEEKVKDVFPVEKDESHAQPPEKKVPGYIMEKIERLFNEAKVDRSKAIILKNELDRWDLYKAYEDRFLDLFKDSQ